MTRYNIKYCLLIVLFIATKFAFSQTDISSDENESVRLEMIDMQKKLKSFLAEKTSSNDNDYLFDEMNKKWAHYSDSLQGQLAKHQQEIDELKLRLKNLEDKSKATPEVVTTKFDNIMTVLYFEVGAYALSTENKAIVKKIVEENKDKVLQLVAYTDWVGNNEYNQQLSNQRAKAVEDEMIVHGFLIQNMKIYSRGKMADENEKLSAKECRRVEIRY